jgi:trimethylamine--corrinoid protein Co-methyltransferase
MNIKPIEVLNEKELNMIYTGIVEVFEKTGVKVENENALRILHEGHCKVNFHNKTAIIPEHVLQDALSSVPDSVTLYGQKPEHNIKLGRGKPTRIMGSSAAQFILDINNARRLATLQDLSDLTRFYDHIDNCHIMQQAAIPSDIAESKHDRITFATLMANSSKHNWTWPEDPESIFDHIKLASIALGNNKISEKPIFSEGLCLMCPLLIPADVADMLITTARHGIPLFIEVDPMIGATAPVTVAGTLIMQTATILGGVVLAQLVNRGAPCVYVLASGLMDMRNGNFAGAAPEVTLSYIGATQLAHRYGLPIVVGSSIDSNTSDVQSGYEKALQFLPLLQARPDIIHLGIGMLEQMMLVSYVQAIIDNEIINASMRLMKGIEVSEKTMAVDPICEIGHGGNYLTHSHTLDLFKRELWIPEISIREKKDAWDERGCKTVQHIANEKAKKILENHHAQPLSSSAEKELYALAEELQKKAVIE